LCHHLAQDLGPFHDFNPLRTSFWNVFPPSTSTQRNHFFTPKKADVCTGYAIRAASSVSQSFHRQTKKLEPNGPTENRERARNVLDRLLRLRLWTVKRRLLCWRSNPTLDAPLHSEASGCRRGHRSQLSLESWIADDRPATRPEGPAHERCWPSGRLFLP